MKLLNIVLQMSYIISFLKKDFHFKRITSFYALILASMVLSGCGFHSLYGEDVNNGTVSEDLKQIYIARIPNRVGQVLRESLQQNMAGSGSKAESRYVLRVQPAFDAEDIDIHADNTSGWTRLVGRAHWQLFTLAEHPKLLAQGQSRVLDGYTVTYAEPFAQRLNDETALSRMAHALGADITQQVATWFRTGVKEKGNECINIAQSSCSSQSSTFQAYPIPNAMPGAYGRNDLMQSGEDGVPGIASGRVEVGAGRF